LPVAAELDPVGRVEVDALHLAAQPLLFRETGHHEQAVAEDQPIRPVLVVLVKLHLLGEVVQTVEVGEQVAHRLATGFPTGARRESSTGWRRCSAGTPPTVSASWRLAPSSRRTSATRPSRGPCRRPQSANPPAQAVSEFERI